MGTKDAQAAAAAAPATAGAAAAPAADAEGKEAIYVQIGEAVKEMTEKRIGKTGGRKLFDLVVAAVFAEATKMGTFRFNGGFGSLHVRTYGAGKRRLPSGQETTFGERQKLRYEEGVVVAALVSNKGNLADALKARGPKGGTDAVDLK